VNNNHCSSNKNSITDRRGNFGTAVCMSLAIFSSEDMIGTEKKIKGKAVALQAWSGPQGSRKLRFSDFMKTAQDGGKVVSLRHRPPLPSGNKSGTHFCWRLSRPQGHSATGRIMSLKNSSDTIGNRARDLPVCSVVRKDVKER